MLEDFISTFLLIFFAEMLDKTQIAVISLAAKYEKAKVLLGAFSALSLVTAISAFFGQIIRFYVPLDLIRVLSGIIFILFGIAFLFAKKVNNKNEFETKSLLKNNMILGTFILVFIAELGDKTQISVILMSSICTNLFLVISGAISAFFVVTLIGILVGSGLKRILESKKMLLDTITAVIFILIGATLLLSYLL